MRTSFLFIFLSFFIASTHLVSAQQVLPDTVWKREQYVVPVLFEHVSSFCGVLVRVIYTQPNYQVLLSDDLGTNWTLVQTLNGVFFNEFGGVLHAEKQTQTYTDPTTSSYGYDETYYFFNCQTRQFQPTITLNSYNVWHSGGLSWNLLDLGGGYLGFHGSGWQYQGPGVCDAMLSSNGGITWNGVGCSALVNNGDTLIHCAANEVRMVPTNKPLINQYSELFAAFPFQLNSVTTSLLWAERAYIITNDTMYQYFPAQASWQVTPLVTPPQTQTLRTSWNVNKSAEALYLSNRKHLVKVNKIGQIISKQEFTDSDIRRVVVIHSDSLCVFLENGQSLYSNNGGADWNEQLQHFKPFYCNWLSYPQNEVVFNSYNSTSGSSYWTQVGNSDTLKLKNRYGFSPDAPAYVFEHQDTTGFVYRSVWGNTIFGYSYQGVKIDSIFSVPNSDLLVAPTYTEGKLYFVTMPFLIHYSTSDLFHFQSKSVSNAQKVAFDGATWVVTKKIGQNQPYCERTDDFGATWRSIFPPDTMTKIVEVYALNQGIYQLATRLNQFQILQLAGTKWKQIDSLTMPFFNVGEKFPLGAYLVLQPAIPHTNQMPTLIDLKQHKRYEMKVPFVHSVITYQSPTYTQFADLKGAESMVFHDDKFYALSKGDIWSFSPCDYNPNDTMFTAINVAARQYAQSFASATDTVIIVPQTPDDGCNIRLRAIALVPPVQERISLEAQPDVLIYPNPTDDVLYINTPIGGQFVIYNSLGSKVLERQTNETSTQISVAQLASGSYQIVLRTQKGSIAKQFIKL